MSLASLKRKITVGTQLKLARHDWARTVVNGNLGPVLMTGRIPVGTIRSVAVVQTSAIAFRFPQGSDWTDQLSWLYWPKASEVRETPNGFEVDLNQDGSFRELMAYEFVTP